VWGAVSRTVRTPSRVDREFFTPGVAPFAVAGGTNFRSELANVAEIGWRAQPRTSLSYTVSAFHHRFERLRSLDLAPGGATFNNNFDGRLTGLTAWAQWRVDERWRLNGGYSRLWQHFEAVAGTTPLGGIASLGNDPRHRWSLGASVDAGAGMEIDLQVRHMGALPNPAVPAYTALDARWGWRVRPGLDLSVALRNLGDRHHPEWGAAANRVEFARSVFVNAVWQH
jgi:iron complex outermembrane receptor protein